MMTYPQIVFPIVVMVIVCPPILLLTLPPAGVGMVLSGLDIVPINVVMTFVIQILLV